MHTKNNPDYWEILLEFLLAVYVSIFQLFLKDFAIVCYVTIAPYNQYQVQFEILCLLKRTRIEVFSKGTSLFIRFIRGTEFFFHDLTLFRYL